MKKKKGKQTEVGEECAARSVYARALGGASSLQDGAVVQRKSCARVPSATRKSVAQRGDHCIASGRAFLNEGFVHSPFSKPKNKEHKKEENERLCGHEQGESHNHRE